MKNKKSIHRVEGIVEETLPNTSFRVRLDDGREILAYLAGKMRIYRIKVLPGDRVIVELPSPNDNKGRIVYRKK